MLKRLLGLSIFFLFIANCVFFVNISSASDYSKISWEGIYNGGSERDDLFSFFQTNDGGFIAIGRTYSFRDNAQIWLVKTDENGNEEWNKTYGEENGGLGGSVQQTSDGGYILGGATNIYSEHNNRDFWLVKTDENGNEEWNLTFENDTTDQSFCHSIQQTDDGGYIAVGYIDISFVDRDFIVIKIDVNGSVLWNKTFGGKGIYDHDFDTGEDNSFYSDDEAKSIQQTSEGGFIVAGNTNYDTTGSDDIWIIKLNESGIEEWNKTFGGTEFEQAERVQQTNDGGYIIIGETHSFDLDGGDIWIIKIDNNGNKEWDKTIGGKSEDWGLDIQQTIDDGYIIAGHTKSYSDYHEDSWIIKTDNNGTEEWDRLLQWNDTVVYSIKQINDGNYVTAGYGYFEPGDSYGCLIKIPSGTYSSDSEKFNEKKEEENKKTPGFEFSLLLIVLVFIYFLGKRKIKK